MSMGPALKPHVTFRIRLRLHPDRWYWVEAQFYETHLLPYQNVFDTHARMQKALDWCNRMNKGAR